MRNVLFFSGSRHGRSVAQVLASACDGLGARLVVLSRALVHCASELAEVAVFDLSDTGSDVPIPWELVVALKTFPPGHVLVLAAETHAVFGADFYGLSEAFPYRLDADDPGSIENRDDLLLTLRTVLAEALRTDRRAVVGGR